MFTPTRHTMGLPAATGWPRAGPGGPAKSTSRTSTANKPETRPTAQRGASIAISSFAPSVRSENIPKSMRLTATNTPTSRPGAKAM